ncbi:hypothetical protein DSM107010_39580 [Chroococcidiopsis cubana SAG 39.79]|uniref:Cyanovirin-N domain-containing protein n=1 Tax=Chroococcidiopsis cubana SAG 39.79 TaxID=388085 RepID=A0AB37UGR4_9CYAN|nr:hypothetical protein DSM107010_39580 [Chroococcidiopsis cubana SAG 39.79]
MNPLGKEALAGNFSRSCGNIRVEQGQFLHATCKDRSANNRNTSLDLNSGIGNKDGHLTRSGGYISTCKNIKWDGGTTLQADCRTYSKDWRTGTKLDLNRVISNQDGNLTFDRNTSWRRR